MKPSLSFVCVLYDHMTLVGVAVILLFSRYDERVISLICGSQQPTEITHFRVYVIATGY